VCGHLELREYSRVSHARGGGVSCREAGGNSRERLNDGVEQEQDMSPSIGLRNLIRFSPPAASGRGASATPSWRALLALAFVFSLTTGACAQSNPEYKPEPGEAGKDVVWVPTDSPLVEKMLDIAKVTPDDYLIDLGSGDGRTVIAAAKRGLTAHGIEYNPKMVDLARKRAASAGVADRATFEKADLFESDFSRASVITMFLLEDINIQLRPTILDLKPGTRIVSNTFTMGDWQADETAKLTNCVSWCTALLWIVPAKVEGTWRLGEQDLQLKQEFQMLTGRLGSSTIIASRMKGNEISFTTGGIKYVGTVSGNRMSGTLVGRDGSWSAER
jgi:SAM-dependent methyltransferase